MAHSRFLCGWMLVRQRTKLQRPELCDTPCCGSDEHLGCSVQEISRRCNTHFKVLACVVCHKEIASPDATADDAYRMAFRTPCWFTDCHKVCQEQLFQRQQWKLILILWMLQSASLWGGKGHWIKYDSRRTYTIVPLYQLSQCFVILFVPAL